MKTTLDYLEEAKQALGLTSDNALSIRIGITRASMSLIKLKKRTMDDYTCIMLAAILEVDPMEIVATANFERESDEKKKEFWANFRKQSARSTASAALLAIFAGLTALPQKTFAATSSMPLDNFHSGLGNYQKLLKWLLLAVDTLKTRCWRVFFRPKNSFIHFRYLRVAERKTAGT